MALAKRDGVTTRRNMLVNLPFGHRKIGNHHNLQIVEKLNFVLW